VVVPFSNRKLGYTNVFFSLRVLEPNKDLLVFTTWKHSATGRGITGRGFHLSLPRCNRERNSLRSDNVQQQEEELQSVVSSLHFRAETGKGTIYNYNLVTVSNRKNNCRTRNLIPQQEKRNRITIQKYAILSPIIAYGFLLKQINCNSPRKKLDKHYSVPVSSSVLDQDPLVFAFVGILDPSIIKQN
jgi:hypothetical protein